MGHGTKKIPTSHFSKIIMDTSTRERIWFSLELHFRMRWASFFSNFVFTLLIGHSKKFNHCRVMLADSSDGKNHRVYQADVAVELYDSSILQPCGNSAFELSSLFFLLFFTKSEVKWRNSNPADTL